MRDINAAGYELVKSFEGIEDGDPTTVNLDPYLDPVGIWTIGFGHAIRGANGRYLRGMEQEAAARALYPNGITFAQAGLLLRADLLDTCRDVHAVVKVPVTDNEFSALASFEFNCGGLRVSTMLRLLNAGAPKEEVAGQFTRWNKSTVNGKRVVLNGLTRRRKAEADLFLRKAA